ncbi:MAG: FecR domain-containing protein [Bacteroidetes bacterium]|nr:FecR domain-containing protein [Bacteroidota bacterium]MDA1332826.1 FecR domain-containing protein [Bacteroidota bacterium]
MRLTLDDILMLDDWTDADLLSVRSAIKADPELGKALLNWFALLSEAGQQWQKDVPAREGLVLLACRDLISASELSEAEAAMMADAETRLEQAIQRHPAVSRVMDRIRLDALAFEAAWAQAASGQTTSTSSTSGTYSMGKVAEMEPDRGPLRPRGPMRLVRIAMATAAVIGSFFVGRTLMNDSAQPNLPTFAAVDSWKNVTLEDGTQIRLAPGAALDLLTPPGAFDRQVLFTGEAYFDVTSGVDPFVITSEDAVTTVLGTSFGVRTQEGTEVTLVSGRVSLAPAGSPSQAVILLPGQQGRITEPGIQPLVKDVELVRELSWTGLLIFRETPMSDVVKQLADTFEAVITVSDSLKDAPLTGTFEADRGCRSILEIMASALGAELIENEDGSFELSR